MMGPRTKTRLFDTLRNGMWYSVEAGRARWVCPCGERGAWVAAGTRQLLAHELRSEADAHARTHWWRQILEKETRR